ncbi:DUF4442 domain-containing protein [Legionella israelensis]|uniref:DUF4442 domain-containing protein n=1 Tax=Legionella israelensis TaxID=454 RepID=A0AAX1EDC0_9GAMM|nr:DUF4442 domain-containing protein [Legionella israelensis]QBR83070.1 DUF4442 domain-containing protein [Legionella israelensis]QDP71599.1 DUF4442 domain-containing protein [Legionella israelensis]
MKTLRRFKFFLWYFGLFKVALIGYLRPRLIKIDDKEMVVCLPLNRRSRNHLGSMYFGALAVGADLAGGMHGFYHAEQQQCRISLVFKSFSAQFLKRPEADVYFVSEDGEKVRAMIEESRKQSTRVNKPIKVRAFTDYPSRSEPVAEFSLELSIKVS